MLIKIQTREKPAVARRAIFSAVVLLGLVTLLAGAMVVRRGGKHAVLRRIHPRGWAITFQAPRGVEWGRAGLMPLGSAFQMAASTPSGREARIVVYCLSESDAVDAERASADLLGALLGPSPYRAGTLPLVWRDKTLGPFEAVERWDPSTGVVVRTALADDAAAYAISAHVIGEPIDADRYRISPIDPETYHLFEQVCDSVRRSAD